VWVHRFSTDWGLLALAYARGSVEKVAREGGIERVGTTRFAEAEAKKRRYRTVETTAYWRAQAQLGVLGR
jgi:hypothetical protein